MDKHLKIAFDTGKSKWSCELWQTCENGYENCEGFVTADNFTSLLYEIGNKNWIEYLTK